MANDLTVAFRGDTSQLNKALDDARASLAKFAPQTTSLSKQSIDNLSASMAKAAAANKSWLETIRDVSVTLAAATYVFKQADAAISGLEAGALSASTAFGKVARSSVDGLTASALSVATAFGDVARPAVDGFVTSVEAATIDTAATTIKSLYSEAAQAVEGFAKTHGLMLASVADQAAIMTVATTGDLMAFQRQVDAAATDVHVKMAQMEADFQHAERAFATRDPKTGRETAAPRTSYQETTGVAEADNPYLAEETESQRLSKNNSEAMAALQASIKSADETLKAFVTDLQTIPDTSTGVANSIEAALTTIPNYTLEANAAIIQVMQTLASSGDEADKLGKALIGAFRDGQHGGEQLATILSKIADADAQFGAAKILGRSLDPAQAVVFFDAMSKGVQRQRAGLQAIDADYETQHAKLNAIGRLLEGFVGTTQQEHTARQATIAGLTEENSLLAAQKAIWADIAEQAKKQKAFMDAIKASTTPSSRIADLGKRRDTLSAPDRAQRTVAESGVTDQQKDFATRLAILEAGGEIVKGLEGVVDVFRNRLASGRFGSDLDAVLKKPKQFSAYNPDPATGRDPRIDAIDPDSPAYRRAREVVDRQFSDTPSPDVTRGATYYYAPGGPLSSKSAQWRDKMTNTTDIDHQRFGNVGDEPVHSDNVETKRREEIEQTSDAIRQQKALQAGGTASDLAALKIAQDTANGMKDQVAQAQALLAARKADQTAAQGGSASARVAADKAVADAQASLNEKVVAADKATNALRVAQAREGSEERRKLELAGADARIKAAGGDVAATEAAEQQKVEINRRYNQQRAAEAAEAENVRYDALQRSFKNQQELIKQNQQTGDISGPTAQTQTQGVLAREEQAAKEHYAKLLAILRQYGTDSAAAVTKNAQQAQIAQDKFYQESVRAAQENVAKVRAAFKTEFEGIGQNIASSLTAIIEKTGTWRQLMQNVSKQILSQFVSMGVKMVADWAARQAATVALTALAEVQKTAAVTAGETARTSAIGGGALAQEALVGITMAKTILASAAETFAGIFGFLSPVMGPAAAGPAAAGQAVVAAAASAVSLDVGAWNLPSDMLANVHAGEMVVPAGPAAMMRAAAEGRGGSTAQSGGGDTHHHTHFNVTAMDSRDVRRFFSDHSKHIIGAINDGVRSGSHLGFNKLGKA